MNGEALASEEADTLSAVASIVHDLRNPLSTIHGSAELLVRSSLSEAQVQRIGRNVFGASVRMQALLAEFLDRCGGSTREARPCDVAELVGSAVRAVEGIALLQAVSIIRDVPPGLVLALDRHRIQSVFVNLIVNALEVMPDGGTIHVSAASEHHSVLIQVSDTGPGIAPEIRNRLFQPFVTAGKKGGIGLGLALSRQAVIDHGGQMWVEPSRRGACFAFRLPSTMPPRRGASG